MTGKEKEIIMEVAIGKGIMRKLPSYLKHNALNCEKTVAEEVLLNGEGNNN